MVLPVRPSRAKERTPSSRRARLAAMGLRAREGLSRLRERRSRRAYRLLRDVVGSLVLVGLVLGVAHAATGGAWPPMMVVESGSMMHGYDETPYGRFGTLDVGDVAFVRTLRDPSEVRLWVDGGPLRYGRPGDVLAFQADADGINTTIVHRAVTYVEVERVNASTVRYHVRWLDGEVLTYGSEGIYLPALGFDERNGFSPLSGYRPAYSGFVTKGDNPSTNFAADQAVNLSGLVKPAWIVGTVHGEIPWLGLGRLAFQFDQTNPSAPGWVRVGNGFAPVELWTCFFAVLGAIVLVPLGWDTWKLYRAHRARQAERRALEEELRRRERVADEARQGAPRREEPPSRVRRVVEFEPLSR